jgi:hypothetical protein
VMKYKVGKVVGWILINGAMATLCVAGVWFEIAWAGNLFKFVLWFATITYVLGALAKGLRTPTYVEVESKGGFRSTVPAWISILYDILITVLLAACGWFFYATLNVIQAYLCSYITSPPTVPEDTDEVEILLGGKR